MRSSAGHELPLTRLLGRGPALTVALVAGGILWMFHGYFKFVMPAGPDAVWQEDLGYSPILSSGLFFLYNVPGVLALLLTAWAALSFIPNIVTVRTAMKKTAVVLALLAFLLGLLAAVGLAVLLVSPTTGGISFGVPVLGLALILVGIAAGASRPGQRGQQRVWRLVLTATGLVGMATLPVQPLVFALQLLPLTAATATFVLFGGGWIVLTVILPRGHGQPPANS